MTREDREEAAVHEVCDLAEDMSIEEAEEFFYEVARKACTRMRRILESK